MQDTPLIEQLLDLAGVEVRYLGKENELKINCPFCSERGESEDTRFRLGINTEREVGHCYNCQYAKGGIPFLRELAEKFGVVFRRRGRPQATPQKPKAEEKLPRGYLPDEYESLLSNLDSIGRKALRYLKERGVKRWQIARHGIGFAGAGDWGWRIIFPVYDSKHILRGCVGRAMGAEQKPKYLNTPGAKIVWNTQHSGHTAIVCEGILDALSVERAIMSHMPDAVAVARLGSTITPYQLKQLSRYKRVVILPDWDKPGVEGAVELAGRVAETHGDVRVCVPRQLDDSDPGSMDAELIREVLAAAKPWGRAVQFRMRAVISKGYK